MVEENSKTGERQIQERGDVTKEKKIKTVGFPN